MTQHQPARTIGKIFRGSQLVRFAATLAAVVSFGLFATPARAEDAAKGIIKGRVLNAANGMYVANAQVSTVADGEFINATTNDFGEYELSGLPAGQLSILVSFVGQTTVNATVTVEAGKTLTQDFAFNDKTAKKNEDGSIVLDEFIVAQNRYKNAQEIAINAEKNSTNIKDVVSTDSLGYIPSGNIGEFVKFIPGVETLYGGTDAYGNAGIGDINQNTASLVSIRGFGASETAITIDGVPLSGVGPGTMTRAIGLDMASINNASRVEVIKVPTPDMPGDAAGGVINLVTKSAFEYAKPTYTGALGVTMVTKDGNPLKKQPGPADHPTYHTRPNGNISVAVPVNQNFGFTVSMAAAFSYSPNYHVTPKWQTGVTTQYGTANSTTTVVPFPVTSTPATVYNQAWVTTTTATQGTRFWNVGNLANGRLSDITNPFLRQAIDQQNAWSEDRYSGSLKLDWKPFDGLKASIGYTRSIYTGINVDRRLTFSMLGPMEWGPDYQLGRPFIAAVAGVTPQVNTGNSMEEEITSLDKEGVTQTGYINLSYSKGPWEVGGHIGLSRTDMDRDDFKNGHVYKLQLNGSTLGNINFFGIKDGVPSRIDVYDRSGNAVDYTKINKWTLNQVDILTAALTQADRAADYGLDIRRQLDFLPYNLAIKVGASRKEKKQERHGFGTSGHKYKYLGPTDAAFIDSITDNNYLRTKGLGFARGQSWGDTYKAYQLYAARPDYFTDAPLQTLTYTPFGSATPQTGNFVDQSYTVGNYRNETSTTRSVTETTDAYYAMLDGSFFKDRLNVIVGARQGRSKIKGLQPVTDNKAQFLKNPNGTLYTDSIYNRGVQINARNSATLTGSTTATQNGFLDDAALIGRLKAAGVVYPDHLMLSITGATSGTYSAAATTGNLELAMRSLYIKQIDASRTNPVQPSVIMAYKITDKLVFKPSWTREISLPALDGSNSGTAGLVGTSTVTPQDPNDANFNTVGGAGTIVVANPELRPRKVDALNGQIAYYNKYGNVTASYYYKFIRDEWLTDSWNSNSPGFAAVLEELGYDFNGYSNYTVTTTENSDKKSSASGYELSFRQNFGYLGGFMEHFNAFGNYSRKNVKQPPAPTKSGSIVAMPIRATNTWAGGLNFSGYRTSLTGKMTYKDQVIEKNGTFTYQGQLIQFYKYVPEAFFLDIDFTFEITKHMSFFASGKNVLNTSRKTTQGDAMGLMPKYAEVTDNYEFGVNIATGLQFSF